MTFICISLEKNFLFPLLLTIWQPIGGKLTQRLVTAAFYNHSQFFVIYFRCFFFSFGRFRFGLQRQQSIDQAIKRAKAAPVMSKSLCPGWQRGNVAARQRIRQAAGDGQSMANDGGCLHSKMTKQLKNN